MSEKQNCTVAELNGLNCKCADVFIAGPETNERARDGPASLWELIEVAAHLQLTVPPEMPPLNPTNPSFLPFPVNTTNKLSTNYETKVTKANVFILALKKSAQCGFAAKIK